MILPPATPATRKAENDSVLRITKETNRVYPDHAGTVEIHDENLQRTIRVEKFNSHSTVVWNPWTTQKLPDDFDPGGTQATWSAWNPAT